MPYIHDNLVTEQRVLRQERLLTYRREPMQDGNTIIAVHDGPKTQGGKMKRSRHRAVKAIKAFDMASNSDGAFVHQSLNDPPPRSTDEALAGVSGNDAEAIVAANENINGGLVIEDDNV